ncbi:MAG: DNA primase [Candidatus Komeilibacteria bacterium]
MNDQTQLIKDRVDIADLLQEYIKLTPAGVNNFKALCPFHSEKTPSLMVSRDKQIWHCFGCGEGGDIFSWVQKIEGIDFPEALRILAKKANVQLEFRSVDPQVASNKTKLYDINRAAAEYWHDLLQKDKAAQPVRDYLSQREVSEATVETWQLGWSRDSWDDLLQYLTAQGFAENDIFDAGLITRSDKKNSYYDRFRNRLLFPITDHHGQIVGFSGRTMADDTAKYINTPQTLIYNKSRVLYGLDKTKTAIRKQQYAILVEGNMDVISVWQAGTQNVIGVSGTALTSEQIALLKRYTNNVMIAFDADSAGQKAALRGLDLAWQAGLNVKIIALSTGKDPDECIRTDKQVWLDAIKNAVGIMDYYFQVVLKDLDLQRSDHKKQAAAELLPIIARLPDAIDRAHYLQKLADILSVGINILEDKINNLRNNIKTPGQARQEPEATPKLPADSMRQLSERILALLLWQPVKIGVVIDDLLPDDFLDDTWRNIYKQLVIYYNKEDSKQSSDLSKFLIAENNEWQEPIGTLELLAAKDFGSLTDLEVERELSQLVKRLRREALHRKNELLNQQLKQAEQMNDEVKVNELTEQLNKNIQAIHNLS